MFAAGCIVSRFRHIHPRHEPPLLFLSVIPKGNLLLAKFVPTMNPCNPCQLLSLKISFKPHQIEDLKSTLNCIELLPKST